MDSLSQKLKASVISHLSRNDDNIDAVCLVRGKESYTKRDLIYHIENETEFGIDFISNIMITTIDILNRQK